MIGEGWITVNSLEHRLKCALTPRGTQSPPRPDSTGEDVAQAPGGPGGEVLGPADRTRVSAGVRVGALALAPALFWGGLQAPGQGPLVARVVAPMGGGHCGGGPPFRSVKVT